MQPKKKNNQWNPDSYSEHTDFVYKLASPLVDLLDPKEGEMILDAGCGEGSLTLEIMRRGAHVIGVDQSPEMVPKAREKGIEAYEASLTEPLPWREKFDAVFSNAVLHWIPQAGEAVRNIAASLKPGGRFVAEFGGAGNVAQIVAAIEEVFARHPEFGEPEIPWYFPTPQSYRKILEAEGFRVEWIDRFPRPTPMEDVRYWLEIFANGIIGHLSPKQQEIFFGECRTILRESLYDPEKGWVIDYVRLRFKAWKSLEKIESSPHQVTISIFERARRGEMCAKKCEGLPVGNSRTLFVRRSLRIALPGGCALLPICSVEFS